MRSLYESIMQSRFGDYKIEESILDSDEQVAKNTVLTAYREKIMSSCGCTPESEIDVIDDKLYLKLRYDRGPYNVYTHLLGSQNGYNTLKDILKTTDICYVVTDRLVLSGTGGAKGADWENYINNVLDLFENKRWHFVDTNYKELKGKFDVFYVENSYFTEGSRDYKRLCDWLNKHALNDVKIEIHGSHNDGNISVSNINSDCIFIHYMSENCTFTNCKADNFKIGSGGTPVTGRCFFKNTKFNKIDVYSSDSSLLSKLYPILSGIEAVEKEVNRGYRSSGDKEFIKRCLKDNYDVIKKNLQAIGNPDVTINVVKKRGPGYFTFKLQEDKDKYILKSV